MEPRASTALSAVGLAALRRAAVMAHTVGTISLRLTAGEDRIVDDELLGATVVHVDADPASSFARTAHTAVSTRVLDEVLRRMVAVVGAAELTKQLT